MKSIGILQRLRRHEEGATAVEFAIVAVMFFTLMFGIIEYGMIMFTKVALESAVVQASRSASLGTVVAGCENTDSTAARICTVRRLVEDNTLGFVRRDAVEVTANDVTVSTTASPSVPDMCLDDPMDPYPASCTGGFIDNSAPAGYQQSGGITSVGVAGSLVEIRATYLWRVLFPLFEIFPSYSGSGGQQGFLVITSSAVIKNEPFNN